MQLDIEKEIDSLVKNSNRKRKRYLLKMSREQLQLEIIRSHICQSCSQFNLAHARDIYSYVKTHQIVLSKSMYFPLLNLVAGFGEIGSGSTTSRPEVMEYDLQLATQIFSDMKSQGIPQEESTYTAIIRCYCLSFDPETAYQYYLELKSQQIIPKNRTLSPLQAAYARIQNKEKCLQLFFEELPRFHLLPIEKDYVSMFELITAMNDLALFHKVYSLFEEYIFTPSMPTIEALKSIFSNVFIHYSFEITLPTEEGIVELKYGSRQLASIEISRHQRESMLLEISKYANEMRQMRSNTDFTHHWNKFLNYLSQFRDNFEHAEMMVIDGANVGFFESTYPGAPSHIDYDKVEWMREEVRMSYYIRLFTI